MSGWKLSAALIGKQLGNLGNTIAESLAAFDPETATEVDRDNLKGKLREVATRLAEARRDMAREKKEAADLAELIAKDEKAAEVLIAKFEKGEIDETTLNEFAANLEDMKARLPQESQEAVEAQELVDTLQSVLDTIEQRLTEFDRHAKAALQAIAQAKAEKERQALRLEQQQSLASLKNGLGGASTALGALAKKAEKLRVEADATKIVADIGQKPVDRNNAIAEARRVAAGETPAGAESAVERLRRLSGK